MRSAGDAKAPDEFIAAVPGFFGLTLPVQTDLLACYLLAELGRTSLTAADLAQLRQQLQLTPHRSLATYLSNATRAGKGKQPKYLRASRGYALHRAYKEELRTIATGRPSAKAVARDLRAELAKVQDPDTGAYITEAVACFEFELFRAAIVLTWCVAYSHFRGWLFNKHLTPFNAAAALWKQPVTIQVVEDFQDLGEATVIDAARKAKIVSKELHKTLKHLLDQRNSYAHPSCKPIKSSIAEAYIDTTLHEVILKLK